MLIPFTVFKSTWIFIILSFLSEGWNENKGNSNWEFQKEKDGMKIWTRMTPYKLKEFKITTTFNTTIDKMRTELMDVPKMNEWYDMIERVDVLKQISATEAIYKIYFNFPAITSDRYSVLHASISGNQEEVKVKTKYIDHPHDAVKGRVKITNIYSEWHIVKQGNKVSVEHIGFMDPSGSIPQWLINKNVVDSPMKTIANLKKRVE